MIKSALLAAKRTIVVALEEICELTGHRWCHRLAAKSAKLDEKWGTAQWVVIDGGAADESDLS